MLRSRVFAKNCSKLLYPRKNNIFCVLHQIGLIIFRDSCINVFLSFLFSIQDRCNMQCWDQECLKLFYPRKNIILFFYHNVGGFMSYFSYPRFEIKSVYKKLFKTIISKKEYYVVFYHNVGGLMSYLSYPRQKSAIMSHNYNTSTCNTCSIRTFKIE